jgi:hypothetical protein
MTFIDYIKAAEPSDDPRGDFIEDSLSLLNVAEGIRRNHGSPRADALNATSLKQLVGQLRHEGGACDEAIEAAKIVWREYKAACQVG